MDRGLAVGVFIGVLLGVVGVLVVLALASPTKTSSSVRLVPVVDRAEMVNREVWDIVRDSATGRLKRIVVHRRVRGNA